MIAQALCWCLRPTKAPSIVSIEAKPAEWLMNTDRNGNEIWKVLDGMKIAISPTSTIASLDVV